MITYKPLWKLLIDRKMNKLDLVEIANITRQTLADMGKDKPVSTKTLNKICNALNCKIEDIIEHIPDNN